MSDSEREQRSQGVSAALSPEEWRGHKAEFGRYTVSLYTYNDSSDDPGRELQVSSDMGQEAWTHVPQELMHQAAALCLYGQPFGFTWDDVDALRWAADFSTGTSVTTDYTRDKASALSALTDRIEAMLPPREET